MQDYWTSPERISPERAAPPPAGYAAAPPPVVAQPSARAALFELRPLSLGEILDRTFVLYRSRFWLYAGLASLAAAVTTLSTFAQLLFGFANMFTPGAQKHAPDKDARLLAIEVGILAVAGVVYVIAYSLTTAATVSAVAAIYVGEETSVGRSLRTVRSHWFRYILIILWQSWSTIWLPIVCFTLAFVTAIPQLHVIWLMPVLLVVCGLSFIYSPFAYIRNSLGVVVSAVEGLKVRASMRRSKVLVAGHKGRVLGILLLVMALGMAAGVLQEIVALFMLVAKGWVHVVVESLTLATTFCTTAIVIPVGSIALCLFYIDERVRKEGYDIELLMSRVTTLPEPAPPPQTEPPPQPLPPPFRSELA